jgi:hypothetical protein
MFVLVAITVSIGIGVGMLFRIIFRRRILGGLVWNYVLHNKLIQAGGSWVLVITQSRTEYKGIIRWAFEVYNQ